MALNIINRKYGMKLELVAEGTLTADGSEQTFVEDIVLSNLSGFIDLVQLQGGDTIIVRQYVDFNGGYRLYAEESYSGVQVQPALCITPRTSNTKIKVTLQQTAGAFRQFKYEFNREV